jgi:hypothetical protein
MANTKNLDPRQRRKAKRVARKQLRNLAASLTRKERTAYRKAEKSLKAFVLELRAKPKQAAEAPKEG